ncbi:hypothetical protein [Oleiharenicola lentus]|uniref:hypothetical protein n=1 Tax=Oleiharenicola lentus TaxID=2508720 RepID=UPI003F66193C
MTLDLAPGQNSPIPEPPPPWGEIVPPGQTSLVLRIVLADRAISYPTQELRRWEHRQGNPETLTISAGREEIAVEGTELGALRAALDLGRVAELRTMYPRARIQPGPQIRRITIEPL